MSAATGKGETPLECKEGGDSVYPLPHFLGRGHSPPTEKFGGERAPFPISPLIGRQPPAFEWWVSIQGAVVPPSFTTVSKESFVQPFVQESKEPCKSLAWLRAKTCPPYR